MKRVFSHLGFSSATALVLLNALPPQYAGILASLMAAALAVSLSSRRLRQALTVPLCLGAALFSCLLFLCVYRATVMPALTLAGEEGTATFYITELPAFKNGLYLYTAKTKAILMNGAPQTLKLTLTSDTPLEAEAFRLVQARLVFSSVGENAFHSFGSWGEGIYLKATVKAYSVTDTIVFSPLRYILLLRNDIIETLVNSVKFDYGAVSAALVTGDKYYLPSDIRNSFLFAGASHILAVSGLHLSVITGSLYFVLKQLGVPRRVSAVLLVAETLLYMALAAFSGSVVRAGIMVCTVFGASLFQRKADTLNSLGIAVFFICLNPFAVTDAGSVLSVLSVLSLVTVFPYFCERLGGIYARLGDYRRFKLPKILFRRVLDALLISISVVLVTFPAGCLFFDTLNLAGILSNVFVVPLGSLATVLSFLCYLAQKLHLLAALVSLCCYGVNFSLVRLVQSVSALRFLRIPFSDDIYLLLAAVLVLLSVGFFFGSRNSVAISFRLTLVILIFSLAINAFWQYNNANVLLCKNGASVVCYSGKTVVSDVNSNSDYYAVEDFLNSHGRRIDILIDDSGGECASKLCETFGATRVVTGGKSSIAGAVKTNEYRAALADGFTVERFNSGAHYIIYTVAGRTLVCGDAVSAKADFVLTDGRVTDKNGTAELTEYNITYSVGKHYFKAGRY